MRNHLRNQTMDASNSRRNDRLGKIQFWVKREQGNALSEVASNEGTVAYEDFQHEPQRPAFGGKYFPPRDTKVRRLGSLSPGVLSVGCKSLLSTRFATVTCLRHMKLFPPSTRFVFRVPAAARDRMYVGSCILTGRHSRTDECRSLSGS